MLFIISGLDSVSRQFIPILSSLWHIKYLFIPTMIAFLIHSSYVIYTRVVKKAKHKMLAKLILPFYLLLNLLIIVWFVMAIY
ncbi:hypothetical protein JR334_04050 [Clostridia bacterium]|nr:hypothetical protein JR334_04050 [Clostridia bacterium]